MVIAFQPRQRLLMGRLMQTRAVNLELVATPSG